MSLSTTENLLAKTFYDNINNGDWKITAIMAVTSTGTEVVITDRSGRQMVVVITDRKTLGASQVLGSDGVTLADVLASLPTGTAKGLVVRLAGVSVVGGTSLSVTLTGNNPTVLQGGVGVGAVAWKTVVSSGLNPIFGQTTTTLGTATQLSTNANLFATLLIRNQDTVNPFALGDSTVTFATGVRFPGIANEIPVPLNVGINANKFYVIDNGVSSVVVEWMFL